MSAFLFSQSRNLRIPSAVLFCSLLATAACALSETDEIRYVIDGDTVVRADGRHVRLIGINAPEPGKDGAPDQPLARAARARLAELVEKKRVTLVFEQEREDRYGRQLARVQLADGGDAGEQLLRAGLAWVIAIPPNLEKLTANMAAENEARDARRGVWNESAYAPKPADKLTLRDTGFQIIEGRILRVGQGRHLMYFDLTPRVTLVVPRADWKKYFDAQGRSGDVGHSMNGQPAERACHGRQAPEVQAEQDCAAHEPTNVARDRMSGATKGKSSEWVGRHVVARGWVTETKDRLRLRVAHPAMLTWRD